jgi:GntR family transcriptional regulator/MocR family aminotransferase
MESSLLFQNLSKVSNAFGEALHLCTRLTILGYTGPRKDPDYCAFMEPVTLMPKQPTLLILLDRKKGSSLQTQLALNLKKLVQTGVLRSGKAVPSSRELARELQISRNTVIQAYDRLIGEGYLEASARRGLFVSESLTQRNWHRSRLATGPAALPRSVLQQSSEQISAPMPFRPCQPDVRLFPLQLWNRLRARALRSHGTNLLHYQSQLPLGLPALRRSLVTYLRESRGVQCDWRQVAITTGSQQALYLLAHLLLKPSSRVAMEDPGYLGARFAWKRTGALIEPVPIDSEGMRLPQDKRFPADLVYTTPSRQFPTGACLSLSRRLSLVEFAAKTKAWIVEDDYDSEFRYSRAPLPSLQSLDPSGRVIYVGSMSKVLFPSLRIGYVVLPVSLAEKFAALRAILDDHGPLIDQATLAEFIEAGALYTHIRRSRGKYGQRLDTFLESASKLGLPLSFPHTDGGMNLAGFLEDGAQDKEYSKRLKRNGLDVPPLSHYSSRPTRPGLVFGFTAFEPQTIRESMKRVAHILR